MSGCSCAINVDVDLDECVHIVKEGTYATTTDISCHECGGIINRGDQLYIEEIAPFNSPSCSPITKIYTCLTCLSIRKELFCNFFYGNLMWDLEDHITENRGFITEECLANLIPEARAKVLQMIDEYLEQEDWDEEEV